MVLTNVQYFHTHSNKPTFVKLLFSIILSIIFLFLIQPIWLYQLSSVYDESTKKYIVKKELNLTYSFLLFLFCIFIIYKFFI